MSELLADKAFKLRSDRAIATARVKEMTREIEKAKRDIDNDRLAAEKEWQRRQDAYEQSRVAKDAVKNANKKGSTFGKMVDPDGLMAELEIERLKNIRKGNVVTRSRGRR